MAGVLGELELEFALCPFLPWKPGGTGYRVELATKSEQLELLSGVRELPGISSDNLLTDDAKAVLLVVIGFTARKGGGFKDPDCRDP